jgi:hypothetical protein
MPISLTRPNNFGATSHSLDLPAISFFCAIAMIPAILILILIISCQSGALSLEQVNGAFANLS